MATTKKRSFEKFRIEPATEELKARTITSDTSLAATLATFGCKLIRTFTDVDDRENFEFEGDFTSSCDNFYNGNPEFSKFAFTHGAFAKKREFISDIYKRWDSRRENLSTRINNINTNNHEQN